jgi:histidinol-phosphate aminotransferase
MSFTPHMTSLPSTVPFVGPEALERRNGSKILARIGANESVFGPSPKAIAAMQAAAHEVRALMDCWVWWQGCFLMLAMLW